MRTTLLKPTEVRLLKDIALMLPFDAVVVCCGVFRGGDIQAMGSTRKDLSFIAVDSFAGLAEPSEEDICADTARKGELASPKNVFLKNVEGLKVETYEMWITQDSLKKIRPRKAPAMLWLDLDHYQPTRVCLEYFLPQMALNAHILTHDYGFRRCPGVKKACDEFGRWRQLENSIAILEIPHDK